MIAHRVSMVVLWLSIAAGAESGSAGPAPSGEKRATASPAAMTSTTPGASSRHELVVEERILAAEDGLLLGNGDLSVSVYQTVDSIVWRFGKGDVWDRRLDLSDDPKPAHIREIAHGIDVEGWKCGPYGGPVEATRGAKDPKRMKELCQGAPPSYTRRPYPCPKPVGELTLHLPPDLPGLKVRQRLVLEEGVVRIVCTWPSGVRIEVESFVPYDVNALVVRWKTMGWGRDTQMGNKPPAWFSIHRWADPTIESFAARFFADCRHDAFRMGVGPKVTPLPPPSVKHDAGLVFIEQTFPKDPTFPSGFRCVMAPLIRGAGVEPVDMGTTGEARLHVLPAAEAREGCLAVAVATTRDAADPVARLREIRTSVGDAPEKTFQAWQLAHTAALAEFWGKSRMVIAEPALENLWYETLYVRRCAYRRGKVPPGLFLPSTVGDYSHWHGDYHTNYNYQQPFWGDYTANHVELGDSYFDGMDFMLPIGRKIARDYYGCRGAFIQLTAYPIAAADDPLGVAPMGRMAYMTGWAANQYWWRYLYTLDAEWLRREGYPAIRDCALFYTDFLKKGPDGLYHAFPSNQGEDGFSGRTQDYTDRAQVMTHMRYCLRAALRAAEILGVDPDLQTQWRDRLEKSAGDDGRPLPARAGLEKECYQRNPPEFSLGRPYRPQPVNPPAVIWPPPGDGFYTWYFGQYPVAMLGRLRNGDFVAANDIPVFREITQRWRRPNGVRWGMSVASYGRAGAWSESLGIAAPLQEMMLQIWDGALRVFPAWSPSIDARFENLRAEGAFLVSAAWSGGKVASLQIHSERGAECRLYAPWPGGLRVCDAQGRDVPVGADPFRRPSFATCVGSTYTVRPAGSTP